MAEKPSSPRRRLLLLLPPRSALPRPLPERRLWQQPVAGAVATAAATSPTRTWETGTFPAFRRGTADIATVLTGIDRWSTRAELATIHEELPWTELLRGMSADRILDRDKVQLVQYYRGKGLQLLFMGELNDGLSRADEAPQLRALGAASVSRRCSRCIATMSPRWCANCSRTYLGLRPKPT